MRIVMREIFQTKKRYANLPLFEFMRDEALTPRQRLGFFPCMAPFILAFGDLNKYVMRDEACADPYQKLVNAHTYEDDHHWPWYLEDMTALGLDAPMSPTRLLHSLYSDEMKVNRMLMTRLAHLSYGATPVQRLAIIEAIEETGNVLFSLTAALASRIEREENITLRYLGHFHFDLETGHAMNGADHREFAAIVLDESQRSQTLAQVKRVFEYFEEWTEELLIYARARLDGRKRITSNSTAMAVGTQ
jgi:hypothetical protein